MAPKTKPWWQLVFNLVLWWCFTVWAGAPNEPAVHQWVQDTLQTAKEQDIWRDLAIGMIDEVGAVKMIAIVFLFLLLTAGGTILAVFKFFQRKGS